MPVEPLPSHPLLINLSFLIKEKTGISTYATQVLPALSSLDPTLLSAFRIPGFAHHPISDQLTPDQGKRGHLSRLLWTQVQLPRIYQKLRSSLIFSPIPEAPLGTACRSVVMVHDFIPRRFPQRWSPLSPYHRHYIPQVVKQAEHVICNSIATAEDVVQFCQVSPQKVTPILLGYDSERFKFLNLPTQNYFLYLGRLDPYKNVQRLIAAFASLPHRDDFELWLSGPPDPRYVPMLLAQAEALGIRDRLKILGYVPYADLPKLMNGAIALVFPSLWEGFGLPVLEAMACGTPVITSNLSSLPEVAGDAAILVNPYEVGEIATAMHSLATDSRLWNQLRQSGLSRAAQFSWPQTGKATLEILQRLV
jgi:glycosyltransferase involved in cell wall biosynthesis